MSEADEPQGLVPDEEEWPEPALVVSAERTTYDLDDQPGGKAEPMRADTYSLADEGQPLPPSPRPTLPGVTPYEVLGVPEAAPVPVSDLVAPLEVGPPPPSPPAHPYWQGLYGFPWRSGNLGVWVVLSFDFTVLAFLAWAMIILHEIGGIVEIAIPVLIVAAAIVGFWTGVYFAPHFLAIVEETAAGNDEIVWPGGAGLLDGIGKLVYLVVLLFLASLPVVALAALGVFPPETQTVPDWVWYAAPSLVLFPIFCLSSLTAGSPWLILERRLLARVVRRPQTLFLVYGPGTLLMAACAGTVWWMLIWPRLVTILVLGLVWSAALMIHGRLLGRTGWLLGREIERKKPAHKRRQKAKALTGGWGGAEEAAAVPPGE
jgi:hypothetical protein